MSETLFAICPHCETEILYTSTEDTVICPFCRRVVDCPLEPDDFLDLYDEEIDEAMLSDDAPDGIGE